MRKSHCLLLTLTLLSIWMASCTDNSTQALLEKAKSMEETFSDSVPFYLQQIQAPHQLKGIAQANYCFLLYKATLKQTGKPKDSLLNVCIPAFLQAKDTLQWVKARIGQAASFLYTQQPDSVLCYIQRIHKSELEKNDMLRMYYYGVTRSAYIEKEQYPQALQIADSCIMLSQQRKDTLWIFNATRIRLQILEQMHRNDEVVQGYEQLMQTLQKSVKYQSLNYHIAKSLTAYHLQNKNFAQALTFSNLVKHYQRNRYDVPYYQLLRANIYTALNYIDSAKVYYTLASNSLSDHIAAEATRCLYHLINTECPEQAYYIAEKEEQIQANLLTTINSRIQEKKYNEMKLQQELYQLRLTQQEQELWMMGVTIVLLFVALIGLFFYHREKKERLLSEQKLHKEQIEEKARQLAT